MASSNIAEDVHLALQRAKKKINNLQQQLNTVTERETSSVETGLSIWMPSKELGESLVDIYSANPTVNLELRQRLPSPSTQLRNSAQTLSSSDRSEISLSRDHMDWPHATQHPPKPPISCSSSPLSHSRSVCPASPVFLRRSVSTISILSPRTQGGAGEVGMDFSTSRGPSPQIESFGDSPDGGSASRGPCSATLRTHLVSTIDSSVGQTKASAQVTSFERDKNISFLLKELDALRDVNKKLVGQLVQKEKELQKREVEEELRNEQTEAKGWEKPAAVLEEVLAVQKDRDQALMSRLLLANEERDEAVLHSRQLLQASELENIQFQDDDMDVDELLQCICDADVQEVERLGSVLVQHLQLARQRRNDITAQEMKAVMKERDSSLAKYKRLEQDLIQEREHMKTEDEPQRLQKERDGALVDSRQLEAEQQMQSSQDLLTAPRLLPVDGVSPADQTLPLIVQLQQLSKEKQSVEAELQRCQEAERESSERVHRLERLVEVLRKKVGSGSLRAII